MAFINYFKKQFLIVDDLAEMRFSVRSMIETLGAPNIDVASNGEEAIQKMGDKAYDIVLCDYNLGKGQDGQQVLEEARHNKLIKHSTTFMMLTAENTIEMVMGALEYEPDNYISKPFNKDILRQRLDKMMEQKLLFEKVDENLDAQNYTQVIKQCDELLASQSKYQLLLKRTRANAMLSGKMFQDAKSAFKQILDDREFPWAVLGQAKAMYQLEEYKDTSKLLKPFLKENKKIVEAYDWLAKAQEKLGQNKAAQISLERAVLQSPKAVLRQMELGRIANINDDIEIAEQAFRKCISLGQNSCHKSASNFSQLAKTLIKKIEPDQEKQSGQVSDEVFSLTKKLKKEFSDSNSVAVEVNVLEGNTYHSLGDEEKAIKSMETAKEIFDAFADEVDVDIALEATRGLITVGKEDLAAEMADMIKEEFSGVDSVVDNILSGDESAGPDLGSFEPTDELSEVTDALNNKGVDLFNKGSNQEAYSLFSEACEDPKASYGVLLNTIQAIVTIVEEEQPENPNTLLKECSGYLTRIGTISEADNRYKRYQRLNQMYTDLR